MLKPMFKMYQKVVLVRESLKDTFFGKPVIVRKGQKGVVMLINQAKHIPYVGYEVEFFDKAGETIAVSSVKESDIAPFPEDSPQSKRAKASHGKSRSQAA